jgi:hypothetical protein
MGTDYAEKERTFVAGLEADTGRALDAWMHAIAQSGLTERNDIIDWLRQNGFTFSNASWIERIHHNGGRLVYGEGRPSPFEVAPGAEPPPLPGVTFEPAAKAAEPKESAPAPASVQASHTSHQSDSVIVALAAAKGLRPLAELALREIRASLPATTITADGPLLSFSGPKPFLGMLPGAKALRLYGNFGPSSDGRFSRAEAAMKIASKAAPPFAHVIVLADARLVDPVFIGLVKAAHARAHS